MPSHKTVVQTDDAPAAIGPYSQAVAVGNMVFLSGQIPIDPATGELVGGDMKARTDQVMKNIGGVLGALGLTYDHLVKTEIFLKDMDDFAVVNEAYAAYFNEAPPAPRHGRGVAAAEELSDRDRRCRRDPRRRRGRRQVTERIQLDLGRALQAIDTVASVDAVGRVQSAVGTLIRASLPGAAVGELAEVRTGRGPLRAEVVGFEGGEVLLMPLGPMTGVAPGARVNLIARRRQIRVGRGLRGRIVDPAGAPIDGLGPIPDLDASWPVERPAPDPSRAHPSTPPSTPGCACSTGCCPSASASGSVCSRARAAASRR